MHSLYFLIESKSRKNKNYLFPKSRFSLKFHVLLPNKLNALCIYCTSSNICNKVADLKISTF